MGGEKFQKLYIATEKFEASSGKAWNDYVDWSGLRHLNEIIGLDGMICKAVLEEIKGDYWDHIVNEDNMTCFFTDFDFLLGEIGDPTNLNVIGAIRAPREDVSSMPWGGFIFRGYDLLDQDHSVSALTNCGGFPDAFRNDELSDCGLIPRFDRAVEIQRDLRKLYPMEHHADCNVWAVFKWQGPPASTGTIRQPGRLTP
jgi:hypothetical protein